MYTNYDIKEENSITKNKRNIHILIGLIILALVLFLLSFVLTDKNKYIIINNSTIFKYNKNTLSRLVDSNPSSKQRYMVYYEDKHIGNYRINNDMNEMELYFYHKTKKESYTFYTPYIAMSQGISYIKFEPMGLNDNDLDELRDFIGDSNIKVDDLSPATKLYKDVDNDGLDEIIYCVSYYNPDNIAKSFSAVYMKKGGVIYNVVKEYGKKVEGFNTFGQYNVVFILDINKDYNYELVIEYADDDISLYSIYNLANDVYVNMEENL